MSPLEQAVPHSPPAQTLPPVQALPHLPQFFESLDVEVQAPLQLVSPVGQAALHAPCEQVWPVEHALPQVPQFLPSEVVSTQAPPHETVVPVQDTGETPSTPPPSRL